MGQIATMVVKIDANIVSLTKNLDKADKAVLKSAERVTALGKSLTLGVTLPVVVAAAAFSKMAADSQAAAFRMSRVFGKASDDMNQFLTGISKQIPETMEDLQQMSSEVKNLADNLGIVPAASVQMSKALVSLAGDMAAFNHETSIQPAMDALEKGLAGKTKGLTAYGIVIKEADIQQEAFRMGLLHSGQQLTATGMAIAAYNLMMRKSGSVQGEAARTAMDAQRQFAFLKRDLSEMGDQIGALVLPYVVAFAKGLRDLLQWVSSLPAWVGKLTWGILAFAATAGPLLMLYAAFVRISLLFKAMQGISWLAGLASPIGIAVAAFVALAGAIYLAYRLWQRFHNDATSASKKAKQNTTDPNALAQLYGPLTKSAAGGSATDMATGSPMEQLEKRVAAVADAYKYAAGHGQALNGIAKSASDLQTRILRALRAQGDVYSENAKKLRDMAEQLRDVLDMQRLLEYGVKERGPAETFGIQTGTLAQGLNGRAGELDTALPLLSRAGAGLVEFSERVESALRLTTSVVQAQGGAVTPESNSFRQAQEELQRLADVLALARASASDFTGVLAGITDRNVNPTVARVTNADQAIGYATNLRLEQELLKLPDYFDVAGEAAVAFGRQVRESTHDLAVRKALLAMPDTFNAVDEAAVSLGERLRETAHNFDKTWQELKQGFDKLRHGTADYSTALKAGVAALISTAGQMLQNAAYNLADSTGNSTGGQIGGSVGGAIGETLGGPLGGKIGEFVGSLYGAGIEQIGKKLLGIKTNDETDIARNAVVKQNTEALRQVALRLQGFFVNANNTKTAMDAVGAFLQDSHAVDQLSRNQSHKGGLFGTQNKGDLQSQLDAINPILGKFGGMNFDQLTEVAKKYGIALVDKNGRIVLDALRQFSENIQKAAEAAMKFQNSFEDVSKYSDLKDALAGKTTDKDAAARSVANIQALAPNLLQGNYDVSKKEDRDAIRRILSQDLDKWKNGSLQFGDLGQFQSVDEFLTAVGSTASAFNTLDQAANSLTESLTNVPKGFKVASYAFLAAQATAPSTTPPVQYPPITPGVDTAGPLVPTVPTVPTPIGVIPVTPRTATSDETGDLVTRLTQVLTEMGGSGEQGVGGAKFTGPVYLSVEGASDPEKTVDLVFQRLNQLGARGGTPRAGLNRWGRR